MTMTVPKLVVNSRAKHTLYNDLPDDEAQKWYDILEPHSQDAFETLVKYVAADLTMPRYYLVCELDLAFPLALQEHLIASLPGIRTRRLRAGHSPFLSQPDRTAELVIEMAGEAATWE